jgi:dTDP-4-amino-4,6-dideoxy-D-glucose ammonia-lyase
MRETTVLIVGGGRWTRALLQAVMDCGIPPDRAGVVSPRHAAGIRDWLSSRSPALTVPVWDDLEVALSSRPWSAAVVANLPAEHVRTARVLLRSGMSTLVEKPAATEVAELEELIRLADEQEAVLAVGHELLYLPQLATLGPLMADASGTLDLWWHEDPSVHRDGSPRTSDLTTGPLRDYLPHLLSVLSAGVDLGAAHVAHVSLADDGAVTVLLGGLGPDVRLVTSRTHGPRRGLAFDHPSGRIEVDLASDPPRMSPGGDGDGPATRPLQAEIRAFLAAATGPGVQLPNSAELALDVVRLTDEAQRGLENAREEALRLQLRAWPAAPLAACVLDAIREALTLRFLDLGLISSPKDIAAVDRWSTAAWEVTARLADDPFVRAATLVELVDASPQQFRSLSDAIADWDAGQRLIMAGGPARKYWTNTIAPILHSGAIHAARERKAAFPLRVGIYPGLSCMFHCTFCGRVPDARYERASAHPGFDRFVEMFDSAPPGDRHRFYLSGGLEPLTNPRIGDIVAAGAARGFKLSMYTNALMLTPALLRRHPGLWDLEVLRVSLYGLDQPSALAITGHPRSFDQVIKNVVEMLRLREESGSRVRVGFNHVIVPTKPDVVDDMGALVARVNAEAGTRRGLDFVTLREDYSATDADGLSMAQREALRDALSRLQRQTEPGGTTPGLAVDLGYALDPLLHGWRAENLRFATEQQLRPELHAQVSVAVDVLGDVYAYREAAFPERPGGARYIIGRLDGTDTLLDVLEEWVRSGRRVAARPGDLGMLDIFDHVVTLVLEGAAQDAADGFPPEHGPVLAWRESVGDGAGRTIELAHPFPAASFTRS